MSEEGTQPQARVIRTVVVAYTREELPVSVMQVHRRFEHSIGKAGWAIRVRLEPIEDLPAAYDVLVVPPALGERAEAVVGDAFLMVATRETAAASCDRLLREIERGYPLTAERADPNAPKIVTRRGSEIL